MKYLNYVLLQDVRLTRLTTEIAVPQIFESALKSNILNILNLELEADGSTLSALSQQLC